MKAEQRKEIETNKLRNWLQRTSAKMQGRSLYIFVGSLVMIVAVGLIIWFWRTSKAAAESARWMDLRAAMETDDPKKYDDEIIANDKHGDKSTAKVARLLKARRVMYRDGMDRLGSPIAKDRNEALSKVEEGRKLYEDAANDLKDFPVLEQEAWLSCAKAEETLLGVPKEDLSGQFRGNFKKMIECLKKAASINPDSEVSKGYEKKANELAGKETEIVTFYQDLYKQSDAPRFPNFGKNPHGGFQD